jgi:hypothetical protein
LESTTGECKGGGQPTDTAANNHDACVLMVGV